MKKDIKMSECPVRTFNLQEFSYQEDNELIIYTAEGPNNVLKATYEKDTGKISATMLVYEPSMQGIYRSKKAERIFNTLKIFYQNSL